MAAQWPQVKQALVLLSPRVSEVAVHANGPIDAAQVQDMLGVRRGMPVVTLSPEVMVEKLRKFPLVKSAQVRRNLQGRIDIHLRLREPSAIVAGERLVYVDDQGVVFKSLGPQDSADLPVITGISDNWVILNEARRRVLRQAVELIQAVHSRLTGQGHVVSEVHIDPVEGFLLFTDRIGGPVVMGLPPFNVALQRLTTLLEYMGGRALDIEFVDLDYQQQAYIRFKPQGKPIFAKKGG